MTSRPVSVSPGDDLVWRGAVAAAIVITAPLAAVIAAATLLGASLARLRWWWTLLPAGAGAGWLLASSPTAAVAAYASVYEQAWQAAPDHLGELARRRWGDWLIALAPLSLVGGGLAATAIQAWLGWRRPDWRADTHTATRARPRRARRRARRLASGHALKIGTGLRRESNSQLVTLGVDQRGEPVSLTRQQLAEHALVVGATGSGKTTTLLHLAAGIIRAGNPIVVLDCKGTDSTLVDRLATESAAAGRPFYRWSLDGPTHWNPLARGDATRLKDKLVAGEQWTEPHYQRRAERHLQWIARLLLARGNSGAPSLHEVVRYADRDAIEVLTREVPEELAEEAQHYLDTLDSRAHQDLHGAISRLANVTESIAGPWIAPGVDGAALDLHSALLEGAVVAFQLPSGDYPQVCAQIGGMALIELQTVAAQLQRDAWGGQAFVAVDEFSALDGTHLLGLLARGRSAGVSVLLATQELADLQIARPEFADQVLANTSVKLAHRVEVPESAERLAAIAGTRRTWQATHQVHEHTRSARADQGTGLGSMREVDEFVVHPNEIKRLPRGRAVLIAKQPTTDVRLVDVVPAAMPMGHVARNGQQMERTT